MAAAGYELEFVTPIGLVSASEAESIAKSGATRLVAVETLGDGRLRLRVE